MKKKQTRNNPQLDKEMETLLLAISGTMNRIAGNIQILCAQRQMKGGNHNGKGRNAGACG